MAKSSWKINELFLFQKKKKNFNFWKGHLFVSHLFLDKKIQMYTGNRFILIKIQKEKLGYRLGEFISRRRFIGHIKLKNKNKKK